MTKPSPITTQSDLSSLVQRVRELASKGELGESKPLEQFLNDCSALSNPDETYIPHSGQLMLHKSRAYFRIADPGNRWGKSTWLAREGEMWSKGRHDFWPEAKIYSPHNILLLTPDIPTAKENILAKMKKWLWPGFRTLDGRANLFVYQPTGTTLKVMSTSMEQENLQGREYDVILMDELDRHPRKFEEVLARGVGTRWRGTFCVAATRRNITWLDERVIKKHANDCFVVHGKTDDNPYLDKAQVEMWKSGLSSTEYRMRFLGEVGTYEGLVYGMYHPEVHRRSMEEYEDWRKKRGHRVQLYRSLDFGQSAPTAMGWYAADFTEPAIWRYREYYHASLDMDEHVQNIRELNGGERPLLTICDPNSPMQIIQWAKAFPGEKFVPSRDKGKRQIETVPLLQRALSWEGEPHTIKRDPIFKVVEGAHQMFEEECTTLSWSSTNIERINKKQPDHATEEARRLVTAFPQLVFHLSPEAAPLVRSPLLPSNTEWQERKRAGPREITHDMGGFF